MEAIFGMEIVLTFLGAPYISLPIEEQKKMKLQVTKEVFTKIGKIKDIDSLFDHAIFKYA